MFFNEFSDAHPLYDLYSHTGSLNGLKHFGNLEGGRANLTMAKKVAISKNLQFFFYPHETWLR